MKRFWSLLVLAALVAGLVGPAVYAQGPVAQPNQPAAVSTGVDPSRVKPAPGEPAGAPQPMAVWPGPDGYSYVGSSCTYSWVDITGSGTPVPGLTDDSYAGPFNFGFDFSFYGTLYPQFYIGSNGFVSLGAGSTTLTNQCPLPNSSSPNNIIALLWDDLYPNYTSGGVYYQYFASCPYGSGPCTVVEYYNWNHYGGGAGSAGTWEAIFYPNGEIVKQFLDAGLEEGSGSTTGIENNNAPADYGLTYACDTAGSVVDNTCIRYTRPLIPNYGSSSKYAPPIAMAGDIIPYAITVRNSGAGDGTNTTMIDPIPDGVTFYDIVSPPELVYNPGLDQVEWSGQVSAGASIDLVFRVMVNSDVSCGETIVNTAEIDDPQALEPVSVSASTTVWGYLPYTADFEPNNGGFAAGGTTTWAWGTPASGPGNAHSGTKVWATNLAGNYNNSEDGYAVSPPIDLSGLEPGPGDPLLLEWWQWLQTEANYDYASVEVRGGGTDWTVVYGPVSGAIDPAWTQHVVDISAFAGAGDFQVRFHFTSDGSVVYPGWYVDDVSVHLCTPPQPGLYLSPGTLQLYGCNGETTNHTFSLYNNTGADGTFDLAYAVPSGLGSLTGPAQLTVDDGQRQEFVVTLETDLCAPPGADVVGTIDASGNGYSDYSIITKTITAGGGWASVPASAPSWAGGGYTGDGCTAQNAAGQWVTYVIGDMAGFVGFWGYNHDTNAWFQPGAANTPADRWAPDWAYDPQTNLCYLTGGANTPGTGTYNTAYVYDPVTNAFTQLPSFTTVRDFHDSWVGYVDGVKYLCIGGGNSANAGLTSTQCYNIAGGAWAAENATIGAYPTDIWAAADGVLNAAGGNQFWVVAGVQGGGIVSTARYWDDADNAWHTAGDTGQARYRVEGDFFNGAFYQIGGSSGSFNYTPTVVRGTWNGATWTWTQLDDAPNARMDNVVAVTPDTIWSVDGYGASGAAYVDYLLFCPACDLQGWLQGTVLDGEIGDVACKNAGVRIVPGNLNIPADPLTGAYGPVTLNEGVYNVTAVAPGYIGDTVVVTITDEMTETADLYLWRAVVEVDPDSFSVVAAPGYPEVRTLNIDNLGHAPLEWELHEMPAGRLAQGDGYVLGRQPVAAEGIDSFILEQMDAAADGQADFFIAFRDTADLSGAEALTAKADKVAYVRQALRSAADSAQANVRAYLESRGIDYKVFYIDNTILVRGDRALLQALAKFPEVAGFHGNHTYSIMPVQTTTEAGPQATIPWDIQIMQIDRVWNELGVTGQGVIVANVDTGVYYQHEALYPNYLCGAGPHTDCWLDPDGGTTTPNDDNGHGTGTMSQMAADNNPAFQYAVGGAPDAGWIACLGCPGGSCPDTALNACADWLVMTTPNTPDVVNNSWGTWSALCNPWYDGKIAAYRAAGVVPVWAAGNIGNACNTSTPPANSIGTLAVGATTPGDVQADFSSTGPGLCPGRTQFPDVSAPGDATCGATRTGGYSCGLSGTSFAAPRAAGCLALMKSARPDMGVQELMDVIMATADNKPNSDCGSPQPDPNYRYGEGRVNCYEAVSSIYMQDIPWVSEDPISGTVPPQEGAQVEVVFTCAISDVGHTYTGTLRLLHNDPCLGPIDIPLELTCQAEAPEPDIAVSFPPLAAELCPDNSTTLQGQICNEGQGMLQWSIVEQTRTLRLAVRPTLPAPARTVQLDLSAVPGNSVAANPPSVDAPVSLILDDGARESNVGAGGWQFIWANRFTPDPAEFPFNLTQVSVLFGHSDVPLGGAVQVAVYQDADGNLANGADLLATYNATVQANDGATWSNYAIDPPLLVSGPGDVVIALINRYQTGTPGPSDHPAADDTTATQGRSWIGYWNTDFCPDPPILPPDADWDLIDNLLPSAAGNWLIRGYGETVGPVDVPWLSEDPTAGTLQPGQCVDIAVTLDSTGLLPGDYFANLLIQSDDPDEPEITLPVSLTVLAPVDGADFIYAPDAPLVSETVYFSATASGAPVITYDWDLGDGNTASGQYVNHAYAAAGTYTVRMTATNDCGEMVVSHDVVVEQPCIPPAGADFIWAPNSPFVGDLVLFSGTVAQGDTPLYYTWDLGDGNNASGQYVNHAYAAAGTFTVTLTVTNTCGMDDVQYAITVQEILPQYHYIYLPLIYKVGAK